MALDIIHTCSLKELLARANLSFRTSSNISDRRVRRCVDTVRMAIISVRNGSTTIDLADLSQGHAYKHAKNKDMNSH